MDLFVELNNSCVRSKQMDTDRRRYTAFPRPLKHKTDDGFSSCKIQMNRMTLIRFFFSVTHN